MHDEMQYKLDQNDALGHYMNYGSSGHKTEKSNWWSHKLSSLKREKILFTKEILVGSISMEMTSENYYALLVHSSRSLLKPDGLLEVVWWFCLWAITTYIYRYMLM